MLGQQSFIQLPLCSDQLRTHPVQFFELPVLNPSPPILVCGSSNGKFLHILIEMGQIGASVDPAEPFVLLLLRKKVKPLSNKHCVFVPELTIVEHSAIENGSGSEFWIVIREFSNQMKPNTLED